MQTPNAYKVYVDEVVRVLTWSEPAVSLASNTALQYDRHSGSSGRKPQSTPSGLGTWSRDAKHTVSPKRRQLLTDVMGLLEVCPRKRGRTSLSGKGLQSRLRVEVERDPRLLTLTWM